MINIYDLFERKKTRRIYPYGGLLIDTISFIRNKVDTICNYILIVKWRATLCTAWYNHIEFTWSFSCTSLTENNYCLQQVLLLFRICLRSAEINFIRNWQKNKASKIGLACWPPHMSRTTSTTKNQLEKNRQEHHEKCNGKHLIQIGLKI